MARRPPWDHGTLLIDQWCERTRSQLPAPLQSYFGQLDDWYDRFTFRQFVADLADGDLAGVDLHWRPQVEFLAGTDFDFIGRIERLEQAGRLVRVRHPVSPVLEMTEIQTRLLAEQGPAVLFENVVRPDGTRCDIPVLINLFGTVERVAWGMDREPHELRAVGETLAFLKQPEPPGGWREAVEMFPLVKTVLAMQPKSVGYAPCQDVVLTGDQIDLGKLPIQGCGPGGPAPLIT